MCELSETRQAGGLRSEKSYRLAASNDPEAISNKLAITRKTFLILHLRSTDSMTTVPAKSIAYLGSKGPFSMR